MIAGAAQRDGDFPGRSYKGRLPRELQTPVRAQARPAVPSSSPEQVHMVPTIFRVWRFRRKEVRELLCRSMNSGATSGLRFRG